jgi:hypothetical protein
LTVSASTSPDASTQNIVIGIYARNLPRIPGRSIIGMNTTIVTETQEMIGTLYSRSASMIAVRGSYPIRIFALAACTITMIVSTAIPNESISEKLVRKLSV